MTHPAPTVCRVADLQAAHGAEHCQAGEAAQPKQHPAEGINGAHGLVEQPPARKSLQLCPALSLVLGQLPDIPKNTRAPAHPQFVPQMSLQQALGTGAVPTPCGMGPSKAACCLGSCGTPLPPRSLPGAPDQALAIHISKQGLKTPPSSVSPRRATSTSYLCAKKDGVAKGKSVTVMLRSLTARLTMKNSAGFSVDRLR